MGNRKNLWMFVSAGLLAVGAAWFANTWLAERYLAPKSAAENMEPAVFASIDIDFGQRIPPVKLTVQQMPKGSVPRGAFRSIKEVEGKVALQTIYAGEMLLDKKVRDHLGGSTLAAVIEPGKRAVTVRVNDVVGVAGFLLPGNRVDVIATRKDRGSEMTSGTILRDIKVLAVDQTASPDKDKPTIVRAVTLEVTPSQTERLVKATEEGSVRLALRNPTEEQVAAEVVPESVVEEPPKIAAAVPEQKVIAQELTWVTLIRGTRIEKADVLP